jgi:hypothetical protein
MGDGLHAGHEAEQNRKAEAFQCEKHSAADGIDAIKGDRHGRRNGNHSGAALASKADFF